MKKTSVQKNKQQLDIISSTLRVAELFFIYPSIEFTLTEVAEKTKLSKGTVSRIIKHLKEIGFIEIVDLGIVYRIKANRKNWIYIREKIARNFATIVRSNIIEFLVGKFKNPKCIILFGSFRKGEDDEDSDIDIAVEVPKGAETGSFEFEEFNEVEKQLNKNIRVHVFNKKDIDNNVFINIANGIVLYGLLEVSK